MSTKPASDRQIGEWFYDATQPWPNFQDARILDLIARIRAEQAEKATAREQAIRECAELCRTTVMQTGYRGVENPYSGYSAGPFDGGFGNTHAGMGYAALLTALLPKEEEQ